MNPHLLPTARRSSRLLSRRSQQGQALLWLLLGFILSVSGLLWLPNNYSAHTPQQLHTPTEQALEQAVVALLGYAAAYPEVHPKGSPPRTALVPGHLPCPNLEKTSNPGQEATQCSAMDVSSLGRLPWTSLGLPPLKDHSGECLWYAVSGHYKSNPKSDLLNPDTPGQFVIELLSPRGRTVLAEDVVAVVIAPGPPTPGQQRSLTADAFCENTLTPSNFLDSSPDGNGANFVLSSEPNGISRLTLSWPVSALNDRIRWITRKTLWATINQRADLRGEQALFSPAANIGLPVEVALTQRVAECLRQFALQAGNRLPWATPIALRNRARPFETDALNDQANLRAGRLPFLAWDSVQDIRQTHSAQTSSGTSNTSVPVLAGFTRCTSSTAADCRIFRTDICPTLLRAAGYPTPTDDLSHRDSPDGWLDKWKDHVFYVVAPGFTPTQISPAFDLCTTSNCLRVNGRSYAAVVLYSGPPLTGQERGSLSDKQNIHQYLEGINASNLISGGLDFALQGNDRMACLRPNLTLSPACAD